MTCLCHQHGAPRCTEGDRLYRDFLEARDAEIEASARIRTEADRMQLRSVRADKEAAREKWLDHKSTTDSERFMERVREFTDGRREWLTRS